jgi:hypothetical protein
MKIQITAVIVITIILSTAFVAATALMTYGTNESSYRWGYNAGYGTYQCRIIEDGCDGPGIASNESSIDCVSVAANSGGQDTNSTACMVGFTDGWAHWCKSHIKDCAYTAGYQYGTDDWNQHTDSKNYSCPLSQPYWYSNFCKGYDNALRYENSD